MSSGLTTVRTVADLRAQLAPWGKAGEIIALVPTLGALHAGHLSLVTLAKSKADRVVVSIFVNPIQFGPREDFSTYPRDEAGDIEKLGKAGADLVFAPDASEMYPRDFTTKVSIGDLTEDLVGRRAVVIWLDSGNRDRQFAGRRAWGDGTGAQSRHERRAHRPDRLVWRLPGAGAAGGRL